MSISVTDRKVTYAGNGATTRWPLTFPVLEASHIGVIITDAAGLDTTLAANEFQVLSTLDYVDYPLSGGTVLPTGWKITLFRAVPYTQETDLGTRWPFDSIENMSDKLTMQVQQLAEEVSRAVKVGMTSLATPDELINEIRTGAVTAVAKAAEAQASANSAGNSASAAATSANHAAASETNAANSASAAAESSVLAAGSAGLAANSASAAAESAIAELATAHAELLHLRQNSKMYVIGDICYSPNLPSWARLECVVAGTTGTTEPEWTGVGTVAVDGSATWIVDDIRDGALPGDICPPSMIVRPGHVKLMGQLVKRTDYPRLTKFAVDNNLITTETGWSGGLWGLFGAGDGSTTLRLPDLRGEHIRYLDDGRGFDKTNITGNTTSGSTTISNIVIPGDMTTAVLSVGMPISGSGIPTGAIIASIVNDTTITISTNATATATGVTLIITGRVCGSAESDELKSHIHSITVGNWIDGPYNYVSTQARDYNAATRTTNATGGTETRGKTVAYYATMKY